MELIPRAGYVQLSCSNIATYDMEAVWTENSRFHLKDVLQYTVGWSTEKNIFFTHSKTELWVQIIWMI